MKKDIARVEPIQNKIFVIREKQVMLDSDLAQLYGVETKRLLEQVRRNKERFPEDFMIQLTKEEYESLRSQIATLEDGRGKHRKYLPYVFTEQGVAMLSAVLRSQTAIEVSIKIMKAFVAMRKIIKNAKIFAQVEKLEYKLIKHDKNFEKIFKALENREKMPSQGIFFDGQIFDAYLLITKIIKSAKSSVVLIDNYVDESVLNVLSKRNKKVKAEIYTKRITKVLKQDLQKHNAQYPEIELKKLTTAHDRFLIIDKKTVYHFGASLKDAGKKWFAFSKLDIDANDILGRL